MVTIVAKCENEKQVMQNRLDPHIVAKSDYEWAEAANCSCSVIVAKSDNESVEGFSWIAEFP
ncbi:hypothetical protein Back11_48390 [Paenibacillus baekrokdamisoli]|uniref:Uncharacterized protein n=2 Tax=Paenibacillus baekrokdamisoli TaxID=1712516 RepID=A0A3G9JKQ1_9BACL|nr:hypothetical protein [Paenibacillus baekrokdamisoli]BBH23494.1 hypothetical protein Back11_48390 [Paenibacillus baekrokdamisoli]